MLFTIWVTKVCNFRCEYCYEGLEKEVSDLKMDTSDQIIKFIENEIEKKKAEQIQIRFHGGEPLLNFEIIKYMVLRLMELEEEGKNSIIFEMTTNGYLLNEESIKFIADYFDEVSVSIDGKKESNDKLRKRKDGKGTYETVMKNALRLMEKKKDLIIRMTVNADNVYQMYDNVVHIAEQGFQVIIPVIDIWDTNWNQELLDILEKECVTIEKYLDVQGMESREIALPIYQKVRSPVCTGGISSFQIDTEGDLYPCSFSVGNKEECCGNVLNGVNQNKIEEFRKIICKEVSVCEGCSRYDICPTVRCKFVNNKKMGDYIKPIPVLCNLQQRMEVRGF